ncbi:MAG TPA: hypothetical protein VGL39_05840 [Jatrophihabitantaceae bacterium]
MVNDQSGNAGVAADLEAINSVVETFFAAFASGPDCTVRLDALRTLFLPEAVIVRTCGNEPVRYGVDGFIAPRPEGWRISAVAWDDEREGLTVESD